jgi:hypothetical protein
MTTGILLIMVGSNRLYQHWAENLVTTIRHIHPTMPIRIVTSGMYLQPRYAEGVTYVTANANHYNHAGRFAPGKIKLHMDMYSDFDRTIYLDVDGAVINDLEKAADCFGEVGIQCTARYTHEDTTWKCQWASLEQVREWYELPPTYMIPELNSSFVVWSKGEVAERFFAQARANFKEDYNGQNWGRTFPDELAFNVSFAQTGIDPMPNRTDAHWPICFNISWGGFASAGEAKAAGVAVLGLFGEMNGQFKRQYEAYDAVLGNAHKAVYGCWPMMKAYQLMRGKFVKTNR